LNKKKGRETEEQIISGSNLADKMCMNWVDISHVPFYISVSRMKAHKRYFTSTYTLL